MQAELSGNRVKPDSSCSDSLIHSQVDQSSSCLLVLVLVLVVVSVPVASAFGG